MLGFAFAAGVFAPWHAAHAAAAFVQSKSAASSANPITVSFTNSVKAGDVIAVAVTWQCATYDLTGFTDTCGTGGASDSYVFTERRFEYSPGYCAAMAYAVIAKSGACTVNAGFTGVVFGDIIAHEISGVNTASPLDTSKIGPFNNPNSGADAVEGGNIAVQGADYIFAFVAGNSAGDTLSAGTGFVQRQYEHNSRPTLLTQDRVVGVAGKVPITFGVDNSGDTYAVGGMAFFPAGGAQVSSRSDALSDSRPSATSNHSFSFTTQKAVTGSSTITLALPRSAAPSAGRGTCWCRSAYP